jgi:hypothetical protein
MKRKPKCAICGHRIQEDPKKPHTRADTMAHQIYDKWICGDCRDVIREW